MNWEYNTDWRDLTDLQNHLDIMGREGWELVQCWFQYAPADSSWMSARAFAVMKRPVDGQWPMEARPPLYKLTPPDTVELVPEAPAVPYDIPPAPVVQPKTPNEIDEIDVPF